MKKQNIGTHTKIPPPPNTVKAFKLKEHIFDTALTEDQKLRICERYLRKYFFKTDSKGKPLPFCKTYDGKDVYCKTSTYHLLKVSVNGGIRTIDTKRLERIRWIIPIISGMCVNVIMHEDGEKRRYYLNPVKHLVVLKENPNGSFNLTTSFKVDRQAKKKQIKDLFGI